LPSSELSNIIVIISAIELSTLVRRFEAGTGTSGDRSGQTEMKSPPGPNLHSGSIGLFSRMFIFLQSALLIIAPVMEYLKILPTDISIGNAKAKTLTKTEQKPVNWKFFSIP